MRIFEFVRKLNLGVKLNVLAFLIFSLLLGGMILATNLSLNSFVLQAGRQNVTQDAQTIQVRFGEIEQEMLNNSIALTNIPGLPEALANGSIQSIQSEILIAAGRLEFDNIDIVDTKGNRLFDTTGTGSEDEDRLFKLALLGFDATGLTVSTEKGPAEISIAAVIPIHDASGATIGALLGSQVIDNEMLSRVNVFSGHSLELGLIVDGQIIANDFNNAEDLKYFSSRLLDANSVTQALNGQTILANQLITNPSGTPHALGYTPLTVGADTRAVIGLAVNMGELSGIKGQLISNQRNIFAIFAIIGNIILAFFAAHGITNPIRRLELAAKQVTKGDYTQRVSSNSEDEIGKLSNSFDTMAAQIQDLITGLEQRVEERTAELEHRSLELEQTSKQSEKRADELQIIAEVARYISTEKELERLLPLITQIVSERFGFYHVGIFLLNEGKKFAVLRAANSSGGQIMLKRQHKLEVGLVGIVGNTTSTGKPRIALDTGADAVYFNNPDLPETRSEMALPLTARGTIIGALDVQSTMPNAFTDADVSIFGLLADQLAIAIDNVRLLDETQNALNEAQTSFRNYLADAWQRKSTSEIIGYHQTLTGGQLISGKAVQEIEDRVGAEKDTLAVPIRLRDQVIGTLNVRPNNDGRTWSTEEINIVEAVTERLGLALDNARLFEETSSRALREHIVSDITTKIRSTNDPQEMINTAMQELQRALGATRVEIAPQKVSPPPDK